MGWTTMPKPENVKAYMDDMYGRYVDEADYKVLASAIVGRTAYYCAVERIDRKTGERIVWAGVAALGYWPRDTEGFTFGYKDMAEGMGPVLRTCPKTILDLLTPTDDRYSLEWRAACRTRLALMEKAKKVTTGTLIRLPEAIRFTDGIDRQEFTAIRKGSAVRFITHDNRQVNLTGWRESEFEIVSSGMG